MRQVHERRVCVRMATVRPDERKQRLIQLLITRPYAAYGYESLVAPVRLLAIDFSEQNGLV